MVIFFLPSIHIFFFICYSRFFFTGSCLGNGKDKAPGGWACLTRYFSKKKFMCEVLKSGNALGTTNNRMEITAVISGLNPLKRMSLPVSISIFTDSKYTLNGATDWINKWKKNGWRTGKNEVKNKDLWEELDILVSLHKPKWKWVKAHSKTSDGWQHNHTVDEEARKQATLIK